MRHGAVLILLAAALAACGVKKESAHGAAPAGDSCFAQATRSWQIGGEIYRIDASAHGPTCPQAQATMLLRAPDGRVLYSGSFMTASVPLSFNPHGDAAALNDDINLWIENQAPGASASALPAWPADAAKPPHFRPEVARDAYEAARSDERPIFCFPDSGESDACVALDTEAHTALLLGSSTPETE